MRPAGGVRLFTVVIGAWLLAATAAAEAPLPDLPDIPSFENRPTVLTPVDQIERFFDAGQRLWESGEHELAERYFSAALRLNTPVRQKRGLLLNLADHYQEAGELAKAAAVLERFASEFPRDADLPATYLRLGALYRTIGAPKLAISKYYQVLNATIAAGPEIVTAHTRLAHQARLAMADIHLELGDLTSAARLYQRISRLDLEPADRERVAFRTGLLHYRHGNWPQAIADLREFLASHPRSEYRPEAAYLLTRSLHQAGRRSEALETVYTLLRREPPATGPLGESHLYWKQRAGNELANHFYEGGDFTTALALYQGLARLDPRPRWQWPAIYQIGLCFERLGLPDRASAAYREILKPSSAPVDPDALDDHLRSLRQMARWRLDHLAWSDDFQKRLQVLLHPN
ncbi:MAG: hypothetical protein EA425_14190 [Puniceicoccaceae bacterium]|nr:MAG: hypothetical protein EA425_14190 [Puniceicoccaceae bacterium]